MNPLLIFRHIECEGPGYLGDVLARLSIPYDVIEIDNNHKIPKTCEDVSGLVFMGGPMSANDTDGWVADELNLIKDAARKSIPLLGHCLGGQLISKALGANITKNPVTEIGWHPVFKTDEAEAAFWLSNTVMPRELFHWHGETFSLPEGAKCILRSDFCPHQAWVKDNILALQCHVEMQPNMVDEWARLYANELEMPSPSIQSHQMMMENLEQRIEQAQLVADVLYMHWLKVGGLIT